MRLEFAGQFSWLVLLSLWIIAIGIPRASASDEVQRMIARRGLQSGSRNSSSHHGFYTSRSTISTPVPPVTLSSENPPSSTVTIPGSSPTTIRKSSSVATSSPGLPSPDPSSLSTSSSSRPLIPTQGTTSGTAHESGSNPSSNNPSSNPSSNTGTKDTSSPSGGSPSTPSHPKPSSSNIHPSSAGNTVVPVTSKTVITKPSTTITSAATTSSTVPFPITLNTDDPQATSSVGSLQNEISVTLIPIFSKLIDTPDKNKAEDAIEKLNKVEPEAKNLLNKINPNSEESTGSCSGGGNLLSDLINAVTCIDDGLNKVKSEIEGGIDDDFSDIEGLKNTVSSMTDLTENSNDEDQSSSDDSTTSTSCSSTTTEDIYVECSATSAPGRKRQAAASCSTSTKTVTGCDISASTTTTTISCSETETITNCDVVCPTTAIPKSQLAGRAPVTASCSTTCSTETACSTTGSTSTSWSTTTTTPSSSVGGQCGTGCSSCMSLSTPTASSAAKRDLDLTKRTLTSPQDAPYNGDTGAFLVDQYVWAEWVPLGTGGRSNPTALYHELKKEKYDMAVQGLYGCTSVVVVSEKAVYMSHFWEVPGFSQGNWGIGTQERFEQEVLTPLESGDGGSGISGLRQYAGSNGAFASQYRPAAYVIRPGSSGRADYDKAYDKKVDQIVEKVKNILGVSTPPIPITYSRAGGGGADNTFTPLGKVLFQYDPVQARQATDSCSIQQAMVRVWVEDKPRYVHQRYWIAYDDQKVAQSGNQKRDCPADATAGGQVPLSSALEPGSTASGTPRTSTFSSKPTSNSFTSTPSASHSSVQTSTTPSSTPKPTSTPTPSPETTTEEQTTTADETNTTVEATTTTADATTTTEAPTITTEAPTTTTEDPIPTTTAAPLPTAELVVAYVVNGWSNSWSVYTPDIYDESPDWCDGSTGQWSASGDISLKNVPYPDGDNDFDFDVDDKSDCSYSSDSDETAGTLSCPDFSEDVQCTEYGDQSQSTCYGVANAMMVVPKVLCQWG